VTLQLSLPVNTLRVGCPAKSVRQSFRSSLSKRALLSGGGKCLGKSGPVDFTQQVVCLLTMHLRCRSDDENEEDEQSDDEHGEDDEDEGEDGRCV
jgi:hypothetical protein